METQDRFAACGSNSLRFRSLARLALDVSQAGGEAMRGMLSGEAFLPRQFCLNGMALAAASWLGASVFLPESMKPSGWLEVANKLGAYRLFAGADRFLGSDRLAGSVLRDAVERVAALEPYAAVWTMEGVGYYFALGGGIPRTQDMAPHVRLPLHTGAGLALAEKALRSGATLAAFWRGCGLAARDGYREPLFEAAGLMAATLYPSLIPELARDAAGIGEEQSALFWHGVGRGLYFSPVGFIPLPGARDLAFRRASNGPANETGRENAMAGLAWAVALVNVRDPETMLLWIAEHAEEIARDQAFRNGVTSALIVWLAACPQDLCVEALEGFRPGPLNPSLAKLWNDTIVQACRDARRLHEADRSGNLAAGVFRVRSLQN